MSEPTQPSGDDADLTRLRVLAAEDNSTNRLVLETLLDAIGVTAVYVDDGRKAVAEWERGGYDLVLMDIQMPELDGEDAAREIRRLEVERGLERTPIVALTADVAPGSVTRHRAAGMDAHLEKPIRLDTLVATITAMAAVPRRTS